MNRSTKILRCSCKHKFQDKEYGKGRRVHNKTVGDKWRCTACGKER